MLFNRIFLKSSIFPSFEKNGTMLFQGSTLNPKAPFFQAFKKMALLFFCAFSRQYSNLPESPAEARGKARFPPCPPVVPGVYGDSASRASSYFFPARAHQPFSRVGSAPGHVVCVCLSVCVCVCVCLFVCVCMSRGSLSVADMQMTAPAS